MSSKDYFTILGVKPGATAAEIKKAYISRTKILHPDRFDQKTQASEWTQANDMLKDLNEAYAALRAGSQQSSPPPRPAPAQGASSVHKEPQQTAPRREARAHEPRNNKTLGALKAGVAFWDSMTPGLRARLIGRQRDSVKPQLHINLPGFGANLFLILVGAAWPVYLAMTVRNDKWTGSDINTHFWVSIGAWGLFSANLTRAYRIRKSNLKNNVFVTPLYFIRTNFDQVRYYPLWDITDFGITHIHRNGVHSRSEIKLRFGVRDESFNLSSKSEAEQLGGALQAFEAKYRSAKNANDWDYFIAEDDFRDPQPEDKRERALAGKTVALFWGAGLVCFLLAMAIIHLVNVGSFPPSASVNPQSVNLAAVNTPPAFIPEAAVAPVVPLQPLPPNGYRWTDAPESTLVVPLEIATRSGSGNYLIKVEDWYKGTPIIEFFVHEGTSVKISVPVGSYRIKYAVGKSWYGLEELFGPDTDYAKVDERLDFTSRIEGDIIHYSGHTLELFLQPNGNLKTAKLKRSDF